MNFFKVFFIVTTLLSHIYGGDNFSVSDDSVSEALLSNCNDGIVDCRMLYTLMSIESDFEPFAIAIETTAERASVLKNLRSKDIRVIYGGKTYHSGLSVVSVYPNDIDTAIFIIHTLEKLGFGFDVGLMQINTVNFSLSEVKKMFYPYANIAKAKKHLKKCLREFSYLPHQVECYNRGAGNLRKSLKSARRKGKVYAYYPYWERYKKHWEKYFGKMKKY